MIKKPIPLKFTNFLQMKFLLIISFITLGGCVSNKFVSSYTKADIHPSDKFVLSDKAEPKIVYSNDFTARLDEAYSLGYGIMGESAFAKRQGGLKNEKSEKEIIEQANKIVASLVIVREEYLDTLRGSISSSTPTQSTTYHSGQIGGTNFSGTSTSYGTKTTEIPYSINYSNYQALFLAKLTKDYPPLGLWYRSLNKEEKVKYERHQGVIVTTVISESPAWRANILPDDILLSFSGIKDVPFNKRSDTMQKLQAIQDLINEDFKWNEFAGILLIRNGRKVQIPIAKFM